MPGPEPGPELPVDVAGNLFGLLWCEGDSDYIDDNLIVVSSLYTTPVDRSNFFFADQLENVAIWELYDPATTPLPSGLTFNETLGRFEASANAFFETLTELEWEGPVFAQFDNGTSGIYFVDINVEAFNCQ